MVVGVIAGTCTADEPEEPDGRAFSRFGGRRYLWEMAREYVSRYAIEDNEYYRNCFILKVIYSKTPIKISISFQIRLKHKFSTVAGFQM